MVVFITIAILTRILPHAPNFTAVGAMVIFSSILMPFEYSFMTVMTTLVISDYFIGFYPILPWVYGSYLLIMILTLVIKKTFNYKRIIVLSLSSSILFYVITNCGVWVTTSMYPKTLSGLIECYYMAIPFFRNSLLGDIIYSSIFYGVYYILKSKINTKFSQVKSAPDKFTY